MDAVDDINIENQETLITPFSLKEKIPISDLARETVSQSRRDIEAILNRTDSRIFVVVGPCSIHDIEAAHEYARRLKELSAKVEDCMLLVMRVYFEKPRTTVGWKGLVNDPYMDDSRSPWGLHNPFGFLCSGMPQNKYKCTCMQIRTFGKRDTA